MVLFRELKTGYMVYSLDKDAMKVGQAKVINIGVPYIEPTQVGQLSQNLNRVVDVTIEQDGKSRVYAIPENASVTYAGQVVLSTESEGILREVQAIRTQSEGIINSYDAHVERVKNCEAIIEELDIIYKDKKEVNARLSKVEECVFELKNDIKSLIKEFRG